MAATSNTRQTCNQFEEDNLTLGTNPFKVGQPYEMTDEFNDSLNVKPSNIEVGGTCVVSINGYSWHASQSK
jgi:hypothetical protein